MNELTNELNEYAKNYHDKSELITKEDFIRAVYYINNLFIDNELDVLVFLLSLNLCNAYAKQVANHDVYKFKKDIATLIKIINERNIPNVYACQTNNNGNLYIFQVSNIQFSFHDEKKVEISELYYKDMTWDGIRKQPCAKTLLDKVLSNKLTDNMLNMDGELIKESINKLIDDYRNKVISFDEIVASFKRGE